jgi:hypothetical protein
VEQTEKNEGFNSSNNTNANTTNDDSIENLSSTKINASFDDPYSRRRRFSRESDAKNINECKTDKEQEPLLGWFLCFLKILTPSTFCSLCICFHYVWDSVSFSFFETFDLLFRY